MTDQQDDAHDAHDAQDHQEKQERQTRQVVLLFSPALMSLASLLPSNPNRSRLLHALLHAYGLLTPFTSETHGSQDVAEEDGGTQRERTVFRILKPVPATREQLEGYHEREYVQYLLDDSAGDADAAETATLDDLGLSDDCPPFPHLPAYALLVAGASLTAASALTRGVATHAMHWEGGRHHAHRGRAAGFCYVQDVVLAIQRLRALPPPEQGSLGPQRRARVLYLDLDLHYSDAVSQAFANGKGGVLTISLHHSAPGFYPATAQAVLTPADTGDPYTVSLPLARGASDASYARIWPAIERLQRAFEPEYLVVQCGLDALSGDPCRTFNLGLARECEGSMGWMVERVLGWGHKTLFLGGGGYDSANAARAWTYLTALIAGRPLDVGADIPDHAFFEQYAPSFTLDVPEGTMRDENTPEALEGIVMVVDVLADRIRGMRGR
ncbi:Arginase/deacetylase [Calocera viscosa TUFC12733]|uniref:histone deacetylase n=1 Tax=Calocera viscosa (strain TUFC12733) TaxID=1330018 RepID=A0A167QIF9_CALVF|nr:Arginase/deacetylase [Calocera viscosa TUFC12733]